MTDTSEQTTVPKELLIGFLNHDLAASDEFIKAVDPYLLKLARSKAPELPADLHQEIVNQTYLRLLCVPEKFDSERGSVKAFLYCELRNAVQQVRAMYCPPGHQTRKRNCKEEKAGVSICRNAVDLIKYNPTQGFLIPLDDKQLSEIPARNGAKEIEIACDARTILEIAPVLVAAGLKRIYFRGSTLSESAESLNVSRFKLSREIDIFIQQFQPAA
jgi:hypothetical protein